MFFDVFKKSGEPRIGIFVDGPNMIRKEFNLDLRKLKEKVSKYGRIVIGKVFLNQFASEKLIEAVANEGFEPLIALGDPEQKTDVDVTIAVQVMEAIHNNSIDIVALVSRDADFLALIQAAKAHGKKVILVAAEHGLASSLKNTADYVEII
jgi:uncharacterized protein (TIGR00288 family)